MLWSAILRHAVKKMSVFLYHIFTLGHRPESAVQTGRKLTFSQKFILIFEFCLNLVALFVTKT